MSEHSAATTCPPEEIGGFDDMTHAVHDLLDQVTSAGADLRARSLEAQALLERLDLSGRLLEARLDALATTTTRLETKISQLESRQPPHDVTAGWMEEFTRRVTTIIGCDPTAPLELAGHPRQGSLADLIRRATTAQRDAASTVVALEDARCRAQTSVENLSETLISHEEMSALARDRRSEMQTTLAATLDECHRAETELRQRATELRAMMRTCREHPPAAD